MEEKNLTTKYKDAEIAHIPNIETYQKTYDQSINDPEDFWETQAKRLDWYDQWKKGCDTVLVGHYHQSGIIKSGSKKLIFLGDWLKHFTVTKFDGEKWSQFTWNEV